MTGYHRTNGNWNASSLLRVYPLDGRSFMQRQFRQSSPIIACFSYLVWLRDFTVAPGRIKRLSSGGDSIKRCCQLDVGFLPKRKTALRLFSTTKLNLLSHLMESLNFSEANGRTKIGSERRQRRRADFPWAVHTFAFYKVSHRRITWAMVNTHYMVDGHPIHKKDPYNGYYKSLWTIGWLAPINGY